MTVHNITSTLDASMERWAVPGLSIGILSNGHVTTAAYGIRDLETGDPVTTDTMFGIGSISKMFVATAAVRMAADGRLDLDTPVESLTPAATLPPALKGAGVTLRQLLSHTSGLDGDGFADFGDDEGALERYLASLEHVTLLFRPGASWSYANIGTCIAGHVLARVAGTPFETLIQEELLDPLGLTRTGFSQAPMPNNVATGYDHGPGEAAKPHPAGTTWRSANPAGGMASTVEDLLRFAAFHLGIAEDEGASIIDRNSLEAMCQPLARLTSIDQWGTGWAIRTIGDVDVVEHSGWMDGYRARLTLLPSQGAAVAILNNGGFGHAANAEILEAVLQQSFDVVDRAPQTMTLAEDDLKDFTGRYKSSHIDIDIRLESGDLHAFYKTAWHENDGADIRLAPVGSDELLILNGEFKDARIVFLPELRNGERGSIRFLSRVMYAAE